MKRLIYQSLGFYLNALNRLSPKRGGQVGLRLFCKPIRSKLREQHLAFFRSSEQEDFDFNGVPIKIYKWGSGAKKVLFVHGWQSHSYRWKQYIEALPKEEFTVIAFDAPGHGQSGGDQFHIPMNAFLISLLVEKFDGFHAVIAHSIGSFSVLYALAYYQIRDIGKFVSMASPSRAGEFFAFYTSALHLKEHTITNVMNEFQMQVRHKVADISLSSFAKNLEIPGLIIHDKSDPDTPYANGLELAQVWKKGELITTEGLGHNLKSKEVVERVISYIN
jgi:pimeloyl-ACP methyl ester carboxylesterase